MGIQSLFTGSALWVWNICWTGNDRMRRLAVILGFAALLGIGLPAHAQRGDQDDAYQAARAGAIRPLGEIISKVSQRQSGNFIGSDYDPGKRTYRLKYMQNGTVRFIDVDARTGQIIAMSGN